MAVSFTNNEVLLYLSGQPVLLTECNIVVYQPTIKEIAAIGEEDFLVSAQAIGNMEKIIAPLKEQGKEQLDMYSDFQLFLAVIATDENFKKNIENFFQLVFPLYTIQVNENDMQFFLKEEPQKMVGMVNVYNYETFCSTIKKLFLSSVGEEKEIEYNPANEKAAKIAEKIKAGKEKVRKIKQAAGEDIGSLFANYISVLSIGAGFSYDELFSRTPFQLYDMMNRYWAKTTSDLYLKISTTPLMDVSKMEKPKEWNANLYN